MKRSELFVLVAVLFMVGAGAYFVLIKEERGPRPTSDAVVATAPVPPAEVIPVTSASRDEKRVPGPTSDAEVATVSVPPAEEGISATSPPVEPPKDLGPTWPPPPPEEAEFEVADNLLARNYYVILDGSGSMDSSGCSGAETKSVVSKRAVQRFAKVVPADANLGLLTFDSRGTTERVPLGVGNRGWFVNEVHATRADGSTPLSSAILKGYSALTYQARHQLGYGEFHLVVVTDGEADSEENLKLFVNLILASSPVVIQTMGFCIGSDHSLNQPGHTIYREANSAEELSKGLEAVLAEAPEFTVTDFK